MIHCVRRWCSTHLSGGTSGGAVSGSTVSVTTGVGSWCRQHWQRTAVSFISV